MLFRGMLTYSIWQRDTAQNRDSTGLAQTEGLCAWTPVVSTKLAYPNLAEGVG